MSEENTEQNQSTKTQTNKQDLSLEQMYANFQQNNDSDSQQKQSSDQGSQQQSAQNGQDGLGVLAMLKQMGDKLENLEKTQESEARNRQMNDVLDKVNAHAGLENKDLLRALIDVKVDKDPRLENVFKNMDQDPVMFDKAMEALGKEINSEVGALPNQELTKQVNALDSGHESYSGPNQNKSALDERLSNIEDGSVLLNELRKVAGDY